MPFTEGAKYGIEIFYPYENELHVTKKDGEFIFDGNRKPDHRSLAHLWVLTCFAL